MPNPGKTRIRREVAEELSLDQRSRQILLESYSGNGLAEDGDEEKQCRLSYDKPLSIAGVPRQSLLPKGRKDVLRKMRIDISDNPWDSRVSY